jgi:hypothetical protein
MARGQAMQAKGCSDDELDDPFIPAVDDDCLGSPL